MRFLKTDLGLISERWIISMTISATGGWAVEYSRGNGAFDARTTKEEGDAFIRRVDPDALA